MPLVFCNFRKRPLYRVRGSSRTVLPMGWKIAFSSGWGESVPLARRVIAEGHQAQLYVRKPQAYNVGRGLVPRVDKLEEADPTQRAGMSGYLLPFEIISVHLLVVLIGAAYLARPKRRAGPSPDEGVA